MAAPITWVFWQNSHVCFSQRNLKPSYCLTRLSWPPDSLSLASLLDQTYRTLMELRVGWEEVPICSLGEHGHVS